MFRHQGPGRSVAQNRIVAGYLALVGGFVNCASLVLIGTFTSHVTGNVGRLGNEVALGHFATALDAVSMILAFFAGAFVASMAIESAFFGRTSNAYAIALLTEATLLVLFLGVSRSGLPHDRLAAMEARILCAAMGMQNSLVTRLSGAVVRTTHLTGVITDLGIEAARWFRWWRWSLANKLGVSLSFGKNAAERPAQEKALLLATITGAFAVGSIAGAATSVRFPHEVMVIPILALVACASYAFVSGRRATDDEEHAPKTRR
ncbi:MAG TPA: YoaK family protein [Labilithrix sp.]|nr:YoaK family protein [Labilithrix sp.]